MMRVRDTVPGRGFPRLRQRPRDVVAISNRLESDNLDQIKSTAIIPCFYPKFYIILKSIINSISIDFRLIEIETQNN